MQFPVSLLLSLFAVASTTSAASSSFSITAGASTACGAQAIVDACLGSTQAIVSACSPSDYGCLCQKWTDVLTCFNNCPNDTRQAGVLASKNAWCASAASNPSSTPVAISRPVSTTATATGSGASSEQTGGDGAVRTQTSSGSSSSSTANAGSKDRVLGAGSVIMGLAGAVGAFL